MTNLFLHIAQQSLAMMPLFLFLSYLEKLEQAKYTKIKYILWKIFFAVTFIPLPSFVWLIPKKTQSFSINLTHSSSSSDYASFIINGIAVVWLVGLLFLLALYIYRLVTIYALGNKQTVVELSDLAERQRKALHVPKNTVLILAKKKSAIFTYGIFAPKIVIPKDLIEDPTQETHLSILLAHECIHIRRKDFLWLMFTNLTLALFWFHPLFWIAVKLFRRNMELSCDQQLLNSGTCKAKQYSELLLRYSILQQIPPLVPNFLKKEDIRMRIRNATHFTREGIKMPFLQKTLFIGICFLLSPSNFSTASANFINPLPKGKVTAHFGKTEKQQKFHQGIDLKAPEGTIVRAAADGQVTKAEYNKGYGHQVEITHQDGLKTTYAHLLSFDVKPGDTVKSGQDIGKVGKSGKTHKPHLHFEVWRKKKRVDPKKFVSFN